MRCFVATGIDHHLGLALLEQRDRAMELMAAARPRAIPAANLHLTLAFLGEIAETRLPNLKDCLGRVAAAAHPGRVQFDQAHCFPDPRSRVFAVTGPAEPAVELLQATMRDNLAASGFLVAHERFRPHITLARLKHSFVPAPAWPVNLSLDVSSFALYQSESRNGDMHYRLLHRWELG